MIRSGSVPVSCRFEQMAAACQPWPNSTMRVRVCARDDDARAGVLGLRPGQSQASKGFQMCFPRLSAFCWRCRSVCSFLLGYYYMVFLPTKGGGLAGEAGRQVGRQARTNNRNMSLYLPCLTLPKRSFVFVSCVVHGNCQLGAGIVYFCRSSFCLYAACLVA